MESLKVTLDGIEVFEVAVFGKRRDGDQTADIRMYSGLEQNIFESGIIYRKLEKFYPGIQEEAHILQSFVQLHRFNIGSFRKENRKDNLETKENLDLNPEWFNPWNLEKRGMYRNYFRKEIFSYDNIEKLFNMFPVENNQPSYIDEVLYGNRPVFFISKKGYINYLLRKLNKSYELWSNRRATSYKEIKNILIEEDVLEGEQKQKFGIIKSDFLKLLNITEYFYSVDYDNTNSLPEETLLINIKNDVCLALKVALVNRTKGMRKDRLTTSLNSFDNFDLMEHKQKLDTLINFFDTIVDEELIYTYLAQRLGKFYDRLLGTFYRIVLHDLITQEKLSREEIRLYIVMNLPLKIFNYHLATRENLIRQFCNMNEQLLKNFFLILILRKRDSGGLRNYEKLFFSYLRTYHTLVPLLRDYENEAKRILREYHKFLGYNEDPWKDDEEDNWQAKLYQEGIENSNVEKGVDETETDSDSETHGRRERIKVLKPKKSSGRRKIITANPKQTKQYRNKFIEPSIWRFEIQDFINSLGLNPIELQIINGVMGGDSMEAIGKYFEPIKPKQVIAQRLINIARKFPPKREARQILLD